MNLPSCEAEVTTFYLDLQTSEEIDLRDNRGKRHDLSVILIGVCIALFCKRDGNLLSIHWHIQNHYANLCSILNIKPFKVASRAQLPLVLSKVNLDIFESLILKYNQLEFSENEKSWFSLDGKELRGSIEAGDRRGEAIVSIVNQAFSNSTQKNFQHKTNS